GERLAGGDGAVGLDVEDEAVELGGLLDAGRLDVEGDAAHRREDGVDRDDADGGRRLVAVGRRVAPAPGDGDVEGEPALVVGGGDVEVGVEDLDVGAGLDVAGGDVLRALHVEAQRDRLVGVHPQDEVLQVEDDVGRVLGDAGDRVELVEGVVEPHLGDGGAG